MANKPTQPVFPLGLAAEEQSTLAGVLNTGTIEHGPDAVLTLPEGNASAGLPSSVRYNADSDEFEGFYENGGWLPLGGGGIRWEVLPHASTATLTEGRGYLINNTTGASTVVLPSPTRIGDSVTICDAYGKFATYPLTVSPSGNNLYGSTEDMAITTDNVSATFTWSGPEQGWIITSGVGLGQGRVYSREIFTKILASETSSVALNTPPTIVDVYADGKRLAESKYSLDGNVITFSPSLPANTELQVIEYTPIQLGNGGGSSSSTITWVYNGGSAIGGETEITLDVVVDDVPAIDINGSRQYKNLGFTFDPLTSKITLAQELEPEDEVVVIINGTPNIYNQIDYTLREVARVTNVKDTEVVYFSVGAALSGYKVIYDKETQRAYPLPADIAPGTTAVSLSPSAVLVHSAGSVDLGELAVSREEYVTLSGTFDSGATLNVKNELLTHTTGKYRWEGEFPKTVPSGSTPEASGGTGLGAWVSVGDASLRSDLLSDNGAQITGSSNGKTVQENIDTIYNEISILDSSVDVTSKESMSSLKTAVSTLTSLKDTDTTVQYDGFGNTVFWNGRNLLCFRRSPAHIDQATGKHSACIAEILKDGSASVIWEYVPPAGIAAKEPSISVSNPGNQLIIAFTLHDVAADTYKKTIVGYVDLNNSGAFTSKSDIVTTDDYYQWGNVLTTPDGKLIISRYSITGTEVQLVTSSDVLLNASTTWSVTKSFQISDFPGRSLINETCLGYYRGQMIAVIRANTGSSAGGIAICKTNDLTGANGWSILVSNYVYAGPRIEAYTDFDDPLVITGTTSRPVTPMYRSNVSMTITYDLSTFSTSQIVYQGDYFSCYASAKKVSDGVYELISFDEVPDSGSGENVVTSIHRQNFFISQENRTQRVTNFKANWLQSIIKDTPCFGSLSGVNSTSSSSNMYFSVNTELSGITRLFLMIGPVESGMTVTPLLKRADGTTFASFYNVSIPASTRPQIIELVPVAPTLTFSIFERLNLNFSTPLPLGCVGGVTGARLPSLDRTPIGLYNVVGNTTSPYVAIALGKL